MKTSEFKKQVFNMGYKIYVHGSVLSILPKDAVNILEQYGFVVTDGKNRLDVCRETPNALFDLMVEYTATPIEEREEPKKFYVKPKGMKIESDRTFNYHIFSNTWYLLFLDGMSDFKTQFTLEELKELGVPIEHYDLEEVKE